MVIVVITNGFEAEQMMIMKMIIDFKTEQNMKMWCWTPVNFNMDGTRFKRRKKRPKANKQDIGFY